MKLLPRFRWSTGTGVLVVLATSAVIALLTWIVLWFTPVAEVRDFEVIGADNSGAESVVAASGISEGEKLARISTEDAARAIAAEPWIERVTVDRSWPSTVKIEVQEHAVGLFVRTPDGELLYSTDGVPLVVAPPPEGAVELAGVDPEAAEIVAPEAIEVLEALPDEVRNEVFLVDAPGPREMTLVLHGDRTVYVGSSDNAREKGLAARAVLTREEPHWNVSDPERPASR